jgi:hypothetical protein
MSTTQSEEMMDLLKELAMLKQLDEKHAAGTELNVDAAALESRKTRRQEICEQIKALGGPIA